MGDRHKQPDGLGLPPPTLLLEGRATGRYQCGVGRDPADHVSRTRGTGLLTGWASSLRPYE